MSGATDPAIVFPRGGVRALHGLHAGFVLISALILLVVLTILALAGVSLNSSQTRMAANASAQAAAFQVAEGALSVAQQQLLTGTYTAASFVGNGNGLYVLNTTAAAPVWQSISWTSGNGCSGSVLTASWANMPSGVTACYLIEKLPNVVLPGQGASQSLSTQVYRITSYASQANGGQPVMLQSLLMLTS